MHEGVIESNDFKERMEVNQHDEICYGEPETKQYHIRWEAVHDRDSVKLRGNQGRLSAPMRATSIECEYRLLDRRQTRAY